MFKTQITKILAFCLSLLVSLSAAAHPPRIYVESDLTFWGGEIRTIVDGKAISGNLSEALRSNPEAFEYALKYESSMRWQTGMLLGGLGLALGYLVATRNDNFQPGVYYGVLLGGIFASAYHGRQAINYYHRAINSFNGVGQAGAKTSQWDFSVAPLKDGALLGLNYSF